MISTTELREQIEQIFAVHYEFEKNHHVFSKKAKNSIDFLKLNDIITEQLRECWNR